MRKRFVAAFLLVLMLISMVPTQAFAASASGSLEPGTYIITANLFVPGEKNAVLPGITAYLTNLDVPPTSPVINNAKLIVTEDEMRLQITSLNQVFTLQDIGGCDNAEILEKTKDDVNYAGVTGRITALSIKLNDASGTYVFNDCKEYPTLLSEHWIVPLTLNVDFSSAEKTFSEPDNPNDLLTKEISDESSNVTLTVMTTSDEMKEHLEYATLTVNVSESDEETKNQLSDKYDSEPEFKIYNMTLNPEITGNTKYEVKISNSYSSAHVYRMHGNALSKLEENVDYTTEGNTIKVTLLKLDSLVVLNTADNFEIVKIAYPRIDNVSYTFESANRYYRNHTSSYYNGYTAVAPLIETMGAGKAYTIGFVKNSDYMTQFDATQSVTTKDGSGPSAIKLTLTVPGNENTNAYFVTENNRSAASTEYITQELNTVYNDDGTITVTIFDIKSNRRVGNRADEMAMIENMVNKLTAETDTSKDKSYIYVTDKTVVCMPYLKGSASILYPYTGLDKPLWENESSYLVNPDNIELTGHTTARNVGQYKVTAKLPSGSCWGDGTTRDKDINWEITTKIISATYSEKIKYGDSPTGKVTTDLNEAQINNINSNIQNADEKYNEERDCPIVVFPAETSYEVGKHEFTPELPEGAVVPYGCEWSLDPGYLYVFPSDVEDVSNCEMIDKPEDGQKFLYTGSYIFWSAPSGTNQISGDQYAIEVGDYEITLEPKSTSTINRFWNDGTKDQITFKWSIVEKLDAPEEEGPSNPSNPSNPSDPGTGGSTGGTTTKPTTQKVTANLYLPGEYNSVLPGITVYLNNSNNPIQGTGTPTTPKSNNATLTTDTDGTKTLTLKITNPVFTLQAIGSCSNARIVDYKTSSDLVYQGSSTGKYSTRISEITVELLDDSGEYIFNSCTEYPTLLMQEWSFPLVLAVKFDGGSDGSLDSNSNVNTGGIIGTEQKKPGEEEEVSEVLTPAATANSKGEATAKVDEDEMAKAVEQVNENGGNIVIEPDITGQADKVTVEMTKSSVDNVAKNTDASLTVNTDIASVTIPNAALDELAGQKGKKVTVTTEAVKDNSGKATGEVSIEIAIDGTPVTELKNSITVSVPAPESGNVLVIVNPDGTETVVKKSIVDDGVAYALLNGSATVKIVDNSKTFTDTEGHWAVDSIAFASSHGLFAGVSDTEFAPNLTMSRGMLATVLYRLEDATDKGGNIFADVAEGAWYADAVAWANANGIVDGYGNGNFGPNDNITREQLAVMLYRYAETLGLNTKASKNLDAYADKGEVSGWATEAMQWAVASGLISGRSSTTLAPKGNATRAETATILLRMMELIVK